MKLLKTALAGLTAAAIWSAPGLAAHTPLTNAAPAPVPAANQTAPIQLAQWGGGYGPYYGGPRYYNVGPRYYGGRRYYRDGRRDYRDYRRERRKDRRRARRALGIGAAVVGGAIIANEIARSRSERRYIDPPVSSSYDRHVDWCYRRYRSYRASDNTFQPYRGGRRECYSPYN